MARKSAGLLLFRKTAQGLEVLLVHPGGPFWANKDEGAWSIPKGEIDDAEDPMSAARREFEEELGPLPAGVLVPLDQVKQPGGKHVIAWALCADFDTATFRSNTFTIEWPPSSGRQQEFPEIDRAAWFSLDEARRKILKGQAPLLDQLVRRVTSNEPGERHAI